MVNKIILFIVLILLSFTCGCSSIRAPWKDVSTSDEGTEFQKISDNKSDNKERIILKDIKDKVINEHFSLGPFKLGQSKEYIEAIIANDYIESNYTNDYLEKEVLVWNTENINFEFIDDRVISIEVLTDKYSFIVGIRINDDIEKTREILNSILVPAISKHDKGQMIANRYVNNHEEILIINSPITREGPPPASPESEKDTKVHCLRITYSKYFD